MSRTLYGCVNWNFKRQLFIALNKSSHPLRVRELKPFLAQLTFASPFVAPFTGAWIETIIFNKFSEGIRSHPLRVRELKHPVVLEDGRVFGVAPFTGAWIETGVGFDAKNNFCRTLYGCVNWNPGITLNVCIS